MQKSEIQRCFASLNMTMKNTGSPAYSAVQASLGFPLLNVFVHLFFENLEW
jgi:hypothetical protein